MSKKQNIESKKNLNYNSLISTIEALVNNAKTKVSQTVNQTITITYWHIGQYIVEYEQKGKERAAYGTKLLKRLSEDLTKSFGKGYSYRNLKLIKKFYLTFPIVQTLSAQSLEHLEKQKRQTLSAQSQNKETIVQSVIAQSSENLKKQKGQSLIAKLSWSHFVRLLSVKNKDERSFYMIESVENNWSVRELDRQINASLFERLLLSKDKKAVKELATKGQLIQNQNDLFKDPLVLEFLNLKESYTYSENDLETGIIDNLGDFLLELGKGFSFVARQKRISAGSDHFYIDLVFYNRLLKSHVLIDLKIGKLKHQDIGQMQMYVNYYDREIKLDEENPTVGIILCKEKNDFVIEYSLPKDNKQIFSKEYQLYLPNKEELRKMLKQYL
ncbi:MAG: PDDEXK nuclease domain-containing protein [Polaribacter sp.]